MSNHHNQSINEFDFNFHKLNSLKKSFNKNSSKNTYHNADDDNSFEIEEEEEGKGEEEEGGGVKETITSCCLALKKRKSDTIITTVHKITVTITLFDPIKLKNPLSPFLDPVDPFFFSERIFSIM